MEEALRQQEAVRNKVETQAPESQVEGALALLEDVARITTDPSSRAEINPLMKRLGWWIGLRFVPVAKGTRRVDQRLLSGRIEFGDSPLPVPLFGKDNLDTGPHASRSFASAQCASTEASEPIQGEAGNWRTR